MRTPGKGPSRENPVYGVTAFSEEEYEAPENVEGGAFADDPVVVDLASLLEMIRDSLLSSGDTEVDLWVIVWGRHVAVSVGSPAGGHEAMEETLEFGGLPVPSVPHLRAQVELEWYLEEEGEPTVTGIRFYVLTEEGVHPSSYEHRVADRGLTRIARLMSEIAAVPSDTVVWQFAPYSRAGMGSSPFQPVGRIHEWM